MNNPTIKTKYIGNLRTEATHVKSNNSLLTDAPIDNNGKGETFSPTDLIATALGSCMITIMGIVANTHNINLGNPTIEITKVMASDPRRVTEIEIVILMNQESFTDKEKAILTKAAINCPVAKSLHPDLTQNLKIIW